MCLRFRQLAKRLEEEVGDVSTACLCYMCAVNVEKIVGIWVDEASGEGCADLVERVRVLQVLASV